MARINMSTSDYLLNTGEISKSNKFNQTQKSDGKSFAEMLKDSVEKVEQLQTKADKMTMDLATGKSRNIHETMIAVSKAEIAFQLMTQVRAKAIGAYNEIMRMQV